MSKPLKFRQKNGLTTYALTCGYVQATRLQTGDVETVVKLDHSGGNCYRVSVHEHGGKGQLHYTATESIGHARKVWAEWVGIAHGAVIAQAKADKRYSVASEFCGESEARYIARFEREWLGKSDTVQGAWLLAYADLCQRARLAAQVQATAQAGKNAELLTGSDFLEFVDGYTEALKWSTSCDHAGEEYEDMQAFEFSPKMAGQIADECGAFFTANHADLIEAAAAYEEKGTNGYTGMGYAGHDFWLTRAGHGAGFWDGDLPEELGERLTEASNTAGNREPYIGDDGLIYQ